MPGQHVDVRRNTAPMATWKRDKLDVGPEPLQATARVFSRKVNDRRLRLFGKVMAEQTIVDAREISVLLFKSIAKFRDAAVPQSVCVIARAREFLGQSAMKAPSMFVE